MWSPSRNQPFHLDLKHLTPLPPPQPQKTTTYIMLLWLYTFIYFDKTFFSLQTFKKMHNNRTILFIIETGK